MGRLHNCTLIFYYEHLFYTAKLRFFSNTLVMFPTLISNTHTPLEPIV